MAKTLEAQRLREQKSAGTLHDYLDGLGRPEAREAAPRYVDVMDNVTEEVTAGTKKRASPARPFRQVGPAGSETPDLWGDLPTLLGRLSEAVYELKIDGEVREVTRDELAERFDLVVKLLAAREQDRDYWDARAVQAEANRQWAAWDATILGEVAARMAATSPVGGEG